MLLQRSGQSIIEYTMMIGIIVIVLYYMGTNVKRGVQSLVKVTADQVGNQSGAEQYFNKQQEGILQESSTFSNVSKSKFVNEAGSMATGDSPVYITNVSMDEETDTQTNSIFNGGFTPSN